MRLTLSKKLGFGIGTLIGVLLIVFILYGLFSYSQILFIKEDIESIIKVAKPISITGYEMEINAVEIGFSLLAYLLDNDPKHLEQIKKDKDDLKHFQKTYHELIQFKNDAVALKLNQYNADFIAQAYELIRIEDEQKHKIEVFIQKLNKIDDILDDNIQASIKSDDPQYNEKIKASYEMEINAYEIANSMANILRTYSDADKAKFSKDKQDFKKYYKKYTNLQLSSVEQQWASRIDSLFDESVTLVEDIIMLHNAKTKSRAKIVQIRMELDDVLDDEIQVAASQSLLQIGDNAINTINSTRFITAIALFLTIVVGVFGGLVIVRGITNPVHNLIDGVETVAKGDLSSRVKIERDDEIGVLGESFNKMVDALEKTTVSRDYVENILCSMGESLFVVSLDGGIRMVNPALCNMLGYNEDELIGQPYQKISKDINLSIEFPAKDIISNRESFHFSKKGESIPVLLTISALKDKNGLIMGYIFISEDIRERKLLESQLIQSQKMESIGQLAGGVAHDFNNILTAIMGYAGLLLMKMKKDDPLRQNAEQIVASSERAASLTNSLLAFSRKQIIHMNPLNLNEILRRLEKLLLKLIGEDIELKTVLTDEDLVVMADGNQIEQVLMNLAINARDAMPDGGLMMIETERIEIDEEYTKTHGYGEPGTYALISVADTGTGIDEKTRKRIFEPFFTTKEVGKGTGLGLSIVYGIIKQHKGYINVYSEMGKGTTFKIYLPLSEERVIEIKPAPETPVATCGTETLLLAEDDADVRKFTVYVLEEAGYTVIEAKDGEEAINKFMENKDKVQLLLLDVIMPKKNGKEVYDEIVKAKPEIKALFMSGYTANIIHKKGILEEGLDFVLKPVSPTKLLRVVREVLDRPMRG